MTQTSPPQAVAPSGDRARSAPWVLLSLAAPLIAANVSRTIMQIVDLAMVSRLGHEATAALTPATLLLFVFIGAGLGLVTAVNTYASQSLGAGRAEACARFGWHGVYLALILGLATLPLWWWVESIFTWVGHEPAVRELEIEYARIGLLGIAPAIMAAALADFFGGVHRPGITTVAVVTANLFNVLGNYVLIWGHFGFPEMGMGGAALATVLASCVNAGIMLAAFLSPATHRRFATRAWSSMRWHGASAWKLVKTGLPIALQFSLDIAAWGVFAALLVGRFGSEQLAANNIAWQFVHVAFMPAIGIGMAATAAVGRRLGAGDEAGARSFARWAVGINMAWMGLMGVMFIVVGRTLSRLFTDDPAVLDWSDRLLVLCAAFQLFDAMYISFSAALRGGGDTLWPAIVNLVAAGVVLIGGGYAVVLLAPGLESIGPWLFAVLYCGVLGTTMAWRYRQGRWARQLVRGESPTPAAAVEAPDAMGAVDRE